MDRAKVITRCYKLIRTALDERTPEHERANAHAAAERLIGQHQIARQEIDAEAQRVHDAENPHIARARERARAEAVMREQVARARRAGPREAVIQSGPNGTITITVTGPITFGTGNMGIWG